MTAFTNKIVVNNPKNKCVHVFNLTNLVSCKTAFFKKSKNRISGLGFIYKARRHVMFQRHVI